MIILLGLSSTWRYGVYLACPTTRRGQVHFPPSSSLVCTRSCCVVVVVVVVVVMVVVMVVCDVCMCVCGCVCV